MSEEHAHEHPSELKYVKVAAILGILTAAEVGVIYVHAFKDFYRPLLGAMMLVKFTMVAAYFMHLKFDSKIFRRFFILGIILALVVYGVALWTFTFAQRVPGPA